MDTCENDGKAREAADEPCPAADAEEPESSSATNASASESEPIAGAEAPAPSPGAALAPLEEAVNAATAAVANAVAASEKAAASAERAEANSAKVLELYTLMTEQRNRATLLLTKHVEMFERIKGLANLCRQIIIDDGSLPQDLKSILTRTRNMEKVAERTLASFGAVPIWPERGDAFDETMHRIVAETPLTDAGDAPGSIAECLKMGLLRDGIVVSAAEVIVFGAKSVPQPNQPQP